MESDSEIRGWRALPPTLIIAVIADVLVSVAEVVWSRSERAFGLDMRFSLAVRGASFAVTLLSIAGCVQLAHRFSGVAARAARGAAAALIAATLLWICIDWYYVLHHVGEPGVFETIWQIGFVALRVAPVVGLAIAGWPHRGLAVAALALGAVHVAARLLLGKLADWLDLGLHGFYTLQSAVSLVQTFAFAIAAVAAARGVTAAEPRRAATGLARAGGALRLRVIAALVGSGIGLLVGLTSQGGEGAMGLVKLAMFSGLIINVVADLLFALGAFEAARAELADLPRWPLVLAGGLLAWCAGAMLEKLPEVYSVLYGHEDSDRGLDTIELFSLALPVIETIGIAIVAATISALANRRGLEDLRTHASGKGVGFVGLMLAGIAITNWVVPEAKSEGGLVMMLLCVLASILAAMILMAQLCKLGSEAIEREPGLPSAKLVS